MDLPDINDRETEQARAALKAVSAWLEHLSPPQVQENTFNLAIDAVDEALRETRKYMRHRYDGMKRDWDTEEHLSQLWHMASSQIRPFDNELADLCMVKGHGWADDRVWSKPKYRKLPLRVDQMLERLRDSARQTPPTPIDKAVVPAWFPIVGGIFALLTFISLFYLIIQGQEIAEGTQLILNVWVAFCVAASFSFIGGTASAHGRLPFFRNSPISFSVYGGIAVFVIVLIIMYNISS